MNTDVELRVKPLPGLARAADLALHRAEISVRSAERRLSRFDPDSELSAINRGGAVRVSPLTFEVVRGALEAARATGGLFDPTVLPMLMAAGYDHSFEALTDGAVQPMAHGPIVAGGFGGVRLNVRRRTVQLPDGGGLDLGGIAKGWLADVLAQRLGRYGAALADLGGDIAVGGETDGGSGWEVEISDPFGGDQPLAVLRLRGGGVATSGVLKRRWRSGDGWRHHLIDPRTGRSSESDVAAVTVVAPSAAVAEVAAKAVLLLGATAGAAALEASPEMAGLLVLHDGTAVNTAGFERFCAA